MKLSKTGKTIYSKDIKALNDEESGLVARQAFVGAGSYDEARVEAYSYEVLFRVGVTASDGTIFEGWACGVSREENEQMMSEDDDAYCEEMS